MKTIDFIIVATTVIALELIGFSYASFGGQNQTIKKPEDKKLTPSYATELVNHKNPTRSLVYLKDKHRTYVSPFNDVPLEWPTGNGVDVVYSMVVEMPRGTSQKAEIRLKEELNPIELIKVPLTAGEQPPWNIGKLPMTWEDPRVIEPLTWRAGNGDQVNVIEIGGQTPCCGQVVLVHALAAYATVDFQRRNSLVVVAIAVNDSSERPMVPSDEFFSEICLWLKKTRSQVVPVKATEVASVITMKNELWKNLHKGLTTTPIDERPNLKNTTLKNSSSVNSLKAWKSAGPSCFSVFV